MAAKKKKDEEAPVEATAEDTSAQAAADDAGAGSADSHAAEVEPGADASQAEAAETGTAEPQAEVAGAETAQPQADAAEAEPAEPQTDVAETEEPPADQPVEPGPGVPADEPVPERTLVELAADARYSATGKRKSSIARVILRPGSGEFELNGRALDAYFPRRTLQEVVRTPLRVTGYLDRVDVRARIHGGGVSSQADAVRHGIAKALIEADPNLRGELKRRQLLTRDPRVKERRKAGLKKARKRPQFSKR
jgi:small subunit ribosomal protein S9